MSYLGFSRKLAVKLGQAHDLSEEKQAEVTYAIEALTLNTLDVVLALMLGWALGVLWGTVACLLTNAAFRHNAGGGHSQSPWRCALVTMSVFPLIALAAGQISAWPNIFATLLSLVSIFLGFAFILRYAPVDNSKAPILSPLRRKKLKRWALIIMVIIAVMIIGLPFSGWGKAAEIRMCLDLSLLWVAFNLTPLGHRLWNFIDGIDIKPGRRCAD